MYAVMYVCMYVCMCMYVFGYVCLKLVVDVCIYAFID